MGFVWSESISAGEIILYNVLQEIRDKVDSIKDNLACVSHDTTDLTGHCTGELANYNSGVLTSENVTADNALYNSNLNSFDNGVNTSNDASREVTYGGSDCPGHYTDFCPVANILTGTWPCGPGGNPCGSDVYGGYSGNNSAV